MACHPFHSKAGFTLLEVSLAIMIALLIMAIAVPSITGAMGKSKAQDAFSAFDDMVQEAHSRSMQEGRNYVIVWGRDKEVIVRPEEPSNRGEAQGLRQWNIQKEEALELHLPAALIAKGATPDAIWTFWSNGVCEPAEIRYQGAAGKWKAVYNPFTIRAEVSYE